MVQLREKQLDPPHFRREALEIQALCPPVWGPLPYQRQRGPGPGHRGRRGPRGPGGHGGRAGPAEAGARQNSGRVRHSPEEALRAQAAGADYLGAGAVFHTGTKSNVSTLSYDTLRDICAAVKIPVVAIGGISEGNILQLKGTGIAGAAVVSALFGQPDIQAAAQHMRKLAEEVRS